MVAVLAHNAYTQYVYIDGCGMLPRLWTKECCMLVDEYGVPHVLLQEKAANMHEKGGKKLHVVKHTHIFARHMLIQENKPTSSCVAAPLHYITSIPYFTAPWRPPPPHAHRCTSLPRPPPHWQVPCPPPPLPPPLPPREGVPVPLPPWGTRPQTMPHCCYCPAPRPVLPAWGAHQRAPLLLVVQWGRRGPVRRRAPLLQRGLLSTAAAGLWGGCCEGVWGVE